MKKILIIEDDPAILKGLQTSLEEEHYRVFTARDGEQGYERGKSEILDLIILDLILPTRNGEEICRDLRNEGVHTPILMLTSKQDEIHKVMGLELGADDYVTKPFSIQELKARIRALLRREHRLKDEIDDYSFGSVHVDFKKQEATKEGKAVKLTAKEFSVLKYLVQHEGDVVTRHMLLDDVWEYKSFPTTRTVDNYILSLRKKIEEDPSDPKHLITVHSAGYKLVK